MNYVQKDHMTLSVTFSLINNTEINVFVRYFRLKITCFIHYKFWKIWCCIEYTSPWTRIELETLVVIDTDCIGSCKSNYHTITAVSAGGRGADLFRRSGLCPL